MKALPDPSYLISVINFYMQYGYNYFVMNVLFYSQC